jgi:hypothetical protein
MCGQSNATWLTYWCAARRHEIVAVRGTNVVHTKLLTLFCVLSIKSSSFVILNRGTDADTWNYLIITKLYSPKKASEGNIVIVMIL